MTGKRCIVCGNSYAKDPGISLHRFPSEPAKRAIWLRVFSMQETEIKYHHRVCSRHFPNADPRNDPIATIGKRLASPIKPGPRAKRAKDREVAKGDSSSRNVTLPSTVPMKPTAMIASLPTEHAVDSVAEEQVLTYRVPESECGNEPINCAALAQSSNSRCETDAVVSTALLARIEYLEAENASLKKATTSPVHIHFSVEQIKHDDRLVRFYTGFVTYNIFLAFFNFLGPVVNKLNYWGSKQSSRIRNVSRKLNPENQLFMTLVKLRLNLKSKDLAFRFGLSPSQVSRYLTTWICFLYHHLNELDWMPSVEQVYGTLPCIFRDKFPNTFAIIDGSELFIETPSDLHMQSSTWSQYKHHNTAKFLVACTPNGAISYVSPLYVGSISDVELTQISGFLTKLENKPGISIMADRGFTIKDILEKLGIKLNTPPFMEGRQQLPPKEIETGRKIASLRIHVERAIGRMKNYQILNSTIPISMARLSNQIVCVCAYLSNFQPALVLPPSHLSSEAEVRTYFEQLESDSDCDTTSGSDNDND